MKTAYRYLIIILSCTLLLSACALGPDYQRPELNTPVTYKQDAPWKQATPLDHLDKGPWWELYEDPELDRLEELTVQNNQSLQSALSRVEQARAIAGIGKAALLPWFDLDPSVNRSRTSADLSSDGQGSTSTTYSVPLVMSYEIDLWGRVRRNIEAVQADLAATEADFSNLLLSLQADVARAYFNLRTTDEQILLLQETARLRQENFNLINSMFKHGESDALAVRWAETELATTRAEVVALQKQRDEYEHALAVLTGQSPSTFSMEQANVTFNTVAVSPGLPSSLLERRPDVAAAERAMAAASARIGVAKTAFFPSISLTGNAGYASTETGNLFNWDNRTWGLGPAISLPLFDGGINNARLRQARGAYEEAVANYRQQVLIAFADVEDALSGLHYLDQQADFMHQAVVAAQEAAEISGKRYRAGLVGYLEVIDSERTSLGVQRQHLQIVNLQHQASISLVKALGGGWQSSR